MKYAEMPVYLIALRDSFQGFFMPDIETSKGPIRILPAFGSEEAARLGVDTLSKVSGVQKSLFRICKYELKEVLEG